MKTKIKVSIIIPIHNAEKHLRQCIKSITNQTLKNIEIILVNDGSADLSLSICKEFEKKDDRVIVIDKKNGGMGSAYNRGILKACGEYIAFLDADDWANSNMYEKLYKLAVRTKADVVRCDFFKYDSTKNPSSFEFKHGNNKLSLIYPEKKVFSVEDAPLLLANRMVAWSGIFNSKLIKTMRFKETPGATYQDLVFMFEVFLKAKRVVLCYDKLIHYRNESNRFTSTQNPSRVQVVYLMKQIARVEKMLKDKDILDKHSEEFYYNMTQILCSFWYSIKPRIKSEFYKKLLRFYKRMPDNFKYKYFEKGFRIFVRLVLKDKKTLMLSACYKDIIKFKKEI